MTMSGFEARIRGRLFALWFSPLVRERSSGAGVHVHRPPLSLKNIQWLHVGEYSKGYN